MRTFVRFMSAEASEAGVPAGTNVMSDLMIETSAVYSIGNTITLAGKVFVVTGRSQKGAYTEKFGHFKVTSYEVATLKETGDKYAPPKEN